MPRRYVFRFIPWVHWQELTLNSKADFWVRYLHIGRLMILWNAPKNGTPNREAHIRGTEPTELRIPEESHDHPRNHRSAYGEAAVE